MLSIWAVHAGWSNSCAAGGQSHIHGSWRHAMRRVIALFLPTWSTDRVRRKSSGAPPRDRPLVMAMQGGNRRVLVAVDDAARKLRLAPRMTVAHAQSLI